MRKLLLSSSALVAAIGLSTSAMADVSVSGSFEFKYKSRTSDVTADDGDSYSTDNEVVISFTNKTDSGLTVSGRYDMDADGDATTVDESSITIAGGFGSIRLGLDDAADDAFGIDESDLLAEDSAFSGPSATISTNAGITAVTQTNMVTYFTPAMGGFSAGISYVDAGDATTTDTTAFGAKYVAAAGDGTLQINYSNRETDGTTTDTESSNYGAKLTMGATTFLASYSDYSASGEDIEATGAAVKFQVNPSMHIAGSTMESEDSSDVSSGVKEKLTQAMFEVGYTIAPGLSAFVDYNSYDYTGGGSDGTDDDGTITQVTIKAAF